MPLSRLDRRLRLRAEDAVRRDIRYARDSTREHLKIFLEILLMCDKEVIEV